MPKPDIILNFDALPLILNTPASMLEKYFGLNLTGFAFLSPYPNSTKGKLIFGALKPDDAYPMLGDGEIDGDILGLIDGDTLGDGEIDGDTLGLMLDGDTG